MASRCGVAVHAGGEDRGQVLRGGEAPVRWGTELHQLARVGDDASPSSAAPLPAPATDPAAPPPSGGGSSHATPGGGSGSGRATPPGPSFGPTGLGPFFFTVKDSGGGKCQPPLPRRFLTAVHHLPTVIGFRFVAVET